MATPSKDQYDLTQVLQIVNKAVSKIEKDNVEATSRVYQELQDLGRMINGICHDKNGEPINAGKDRLAQATSELKEVTSATEKATGEIMDACERIQSLSADAKNAQAINDETIKIFEACSFQDLTGQRINNAVNALYEIEKRIDAMIAAIEGHGSIALATGPSEDTRSADKKLMNGPQMPGKGVTQDDIDRLLSE